MEPFGFMEARYCPFWSYGVGLAVPLIAIAVLSIAARRLRAQEREARRTEKAAGGRVAVGQLVVGGTVVEIDGNGDTAVRVTVTQEPRESKDKGKWTTRWTQVEHDVVTRAFYIQTPSGERVRVEPPPRPRLVDEMDEEKLIEGNRRIRAASLKLGEVAYILGDVVEAIDPSAPAGYRGDGKTPTVRADRAGNMLISVRTLAEPFAVKAAHRERWARILLATTLVTQLVAIRYHAALLLGRTEAAVVVTRSHPPPDGRGTPVESFIRYEVLSSGEVIDAQVEREDYPMLAEGTVIPVRRSPFLTTHGAGATEHGALLFFPAVALVVLAFAGVLIVRSVRPWYERARLDETTRGRIQDVAERLGG